MSAHYYPPKSGGSGSGATTYPSVAAFPNPTTDGALAIALDTHTLYVYDLATTSWKPVGTYNPRPIITLSPANISAGYVDLVVTPLEPTLTRLEVIDGIEQEYGVDFIVSGTLLVWNGLGLDGILEAGDKLVVTLK